MITVRLSETAIYYQFESDVVTVWAVIDCRRNPEWIRNQLEE